MRWTAAICRVHASIKNLSRLGCRSCTSKDFWVVVAEGQCANCHDLRDSAEPEVLGIPDLLHVPEALWRMPVGTITISFCISSYGLSKDWGSCTTVLQLLHQLHVFEDLGTKQGHFLMWLLAAANVNIAGWYKEADRVHICWSSRHASATFTVLQQPRGKKG